MRTFFFFFYFARSDTLWVWFFENVGLCTAVVFSMQCLLMDRGYRSVQLCASSQPGGSAKCMVFDLGLLN